MQKEIRTINKKEGIVQITCPDERWYTKEIKNKETGLPDHKFVPSATWICNFYPKGIEYFKWLASKGWDEAEAIKNEAGERGSCVHHLIERLLKGDTIGIDESYMNRTITVSEYDAAISFKRWYDETQPEVVSVEKTFFNEKDGYAGTVDLVCKIDGEDWVIDFKTSAYIWPSHKLQLSCYKRGLKLSSAKMGVLQVGYKRNKKGFKLTEIDDCYDLFEATKTIWKFENGDKQPKQKDYPLSIKLN
jgi:hypothetical protein